MNRCKKILSRALLFSLVLCALPAFSQDEYYPTEIIDYSDPLTMIARGFGDQEWERVRAAISEGKETGFILGAIGLGDILDPAGHKCCVKPPPEWGQVQVDNDTLRVRNPDDANHWLNVDCPIDDSSIAMEGYATFTCDGNAEVAGFSNVHNTFGGVLYQNVMGMKATLGVDGELYGETITYYFTIDLGANLEDIANDNFGMTREVGGYRWTASGGVTPGANADFSLKVTRPGNTQPIMTSGAGEGISIKATIMPDPADVGKKADIYIVDWLGASTITMYNQDNDWMAWDLRVKSLVPHLVNVTLSSSVEVELFEGTLGETAVGDHRIFVAYMLDDGSLYLTPAGLHFTVTAP